ncbi:MAG TPA: copper amine oxidase N-terminal domain-containing protein [Candidatus Eremiobacteraeota bacterium]|mgnify:CR=1 FL=1|nr:MAG: hypothetical protein BWY64_01161 [bacterium ADurb.Bin363]HPZ08680.1 copper amine oxidase N-terminal domain-containing protein [Candidatus Eremiobacteraeota bacterium]
MKKSFIIILLCILMFNNAYAGVEEVKIVVPKTGKNFYTTAVIKENFTVFVPLRDIINGIGNVTIQWEPDEGMITAETREHWCQFWIGSNKATVDGDSVYLDYPPFTCYGRTYVPAKFIGEALGKQIEWNYNTRTITIK